MTKTLDALPPITAATDDPVVTALGHVHGVDFAELLAAGPGGRQIKIGPPGHEGRDTRLPDAIPCMSIGLAGGGYSGQVIVEFGDDAYRYQRATGRATVRIPVGSLPDTVMTALEGAPISSLIDIPGLEGWTVAYAKLDAVMQVTVVTLAPPKV